MNEQLSTIERLQRLIAQTIARESGEKLLLIGGFRYRLLDKSIRQSIDIDYHCPGDLEKIKIPLLSLFQRRLFPEVKREIGMECSFLDKSELFITLELSFYNQRERIEIPVDIVTIPCSDAPETRTVGGTIYLTASDADMVESKIISLMSRSFFQTRDMVDLYLFKSFILPESMDRVQQKMITIGLTKEHADTLIKDLQKNRAFHVRNLDKVIDERIDKNMRPLIRMNNGVDSILDFAMETLRKIS
jgi:hypothetical protein